MSTKKTLMHLGFWISLALIFNIGIYFFMGYEKALAFLGGYVIEQSLSLDNLFLFLLIFESFSLKPEYQKRVLTFGIAGAIILRFIFVILGISIVNEFHWMLYIFGILLIISGFKMFFKHEDNSNIKNSNLLKLLNRIIPVSDKLDGEKFFTRKNGILYATPLLAILILVEGSDIIFAIDSIPAIFSITTDPFIVYTSNIFAILGLRNLYFILEKLHNNFAYVKYGVACILVFTGIKLSITFFHIEISILISLTTIFTILLISIIASMFKSKKDKESYYVETKEKVVK